jgi:hypothetical protein
MAAPFGTAFTYQGRLGDGGQPAEGIYDLRFSIYDSAGGDTAVAGPLTNSPVDVSNGLFTVTLDFGAGLFDGNARWLEMGVRTNGSSAFITLSPRQPLTPAPYAFYAPNAGTAATAVSVPAANLTGPLPVSQLSGIVPLAQLPAEVLTNNATDVTLSGTFTGITGFVPTSYGIGTNLGTVATFTNLNPEMTNSTSYLENGSLWLSPRIYGAVNNAYGGAIHWMQTDTKIPFYSYPMMKIEGIRDWGSDPNNPMMLITAPNVRLEEGWESGSSYGHYVIMGNEAYRGRVIINYQPVEWEGYPTNGYSKPLVFYTMGIHTNGGGTNRIAGYPAIMGRSVATHNSMGPGGEEYDVGELYFYSATPYPYDSLTHFPGITNAIMHTNEWEFFTDVRAHGKFIGDGSGLTGIRPDAGGLTTNLVVQSGLFSTVTLCFTNGILTAIR